MKVIVRGYYGFGNLGDDILLLCAAHIIREIWPGCELIVCTESQAPGYIRNWLPDIRIIHRSMDVKADVIVQGGGGIYFDFKEGPARYGLLNSFIKLIGYKQFIKIYRSYRRIKSNPGISSDYKLGFGIGVGTFSRNSRKFYSSIFTLADYDRLYVRDKESMVNLRSLNVNIDARVSTDLAFLAECWKPENLPSEKSNTVALILRDWPYDGHLHVDFLIDNISEILPEGWHVNCYSLNPASDEYFIRRAGEAFSVMEWDPENMSMETFLTDMAQNQLIISSRAHGAILGACMGIPGICIDLEPKLRVVSEMLSNSYLLASCDADNLKLRTRNMIRELPRTDDDVRVNRAKLDEMLHELRKELTETGNQ